MHKEPQSPQARPRRFPAHLTAPLCRSGSPSLPICADTQSFVSEGPAERELPITRTSESNDSGGSAHNWFDQSNKRPVISLDRDFVDNDPPYFLPQHNSSNTSGAISEPSLHLRPENYGHHMPGVPHPAPKGSNADDFRSVIDDLTIENRKLERRLRKYEASHSAHLEKDRLFEVKMYGLPAEKKRELEDILRVFAASIDGSSDNSAKILPRSIQHHSFVPYKNASLSSSISRHVDSAYASMSNSGPMSTPTKNCIGTHRSIYNQSSTKEQKVQSFLHEIPKGLLPKHSLIMTERQKKKIVVQRLEQLFTGRKGSAIGTHSQPLQQQEVSESAALADRAANADQLSVEGVREAQMLSHEMEIDAKKPVKLVGDSGHEANDWTGLLDSTTDGSADSSLEQRPTRPLDLDPDRAQIPSDNVDYIRHLGISTPRFEQGMSCDVEPDGERWIYLNLLINMAQLHIINVTPDFVRSAVADVSDKFQLSRDGRKIRWKGGSSGTRFSSTSSTSSNQNGSSMDSDSLEEVGRKRRKIDVGRFASIPVDLSDRKVSSWSAQPNPIYYKPLLHHRGSSSEEITSCDESESQLGNGHDHVDEGRTHRAPHLRSRGSHSIAGERARRHDDGPIVFYNGALFCTDLSGDLEIASTIHEARASGDGCSNHTGDVLGCKSREDAPSVARTQSRSLLSFRPFKDYSERPDLCQTNEMRVKTPELISDEQIDSYIPLDWPSIHTPENTPATPLLTFNASGLGGTQPADHFAVRVETRRTTLDDRKPAKLTKFSAPGPAPRKFLHTIPISSLEAFQEPDHASAAEIITSKLESLAAFRSPSPSHATSTRQLPVQTEIISAQFSRLQPSALPAPLGYYAALSSSDSESDFSSTSSFSGVSHLCGQKSFISRSQPPVSGYTPTLSLALDPTQMTQDSGEMQDPEFDDEDNEDDGGKDESIYILTQARQDDPKTVTEPEGEFKTQATHRLMEALLAGSSAATAGGGSGFSSPCII